MTKTGKGNLIVNCISRGRQQEGGRGDGGIQGDVLVKPRLIILLQEQLLKEVINCI